MNLSLPIGTEQVAFLLSYLMKVNVLEPDNGSPAQDYSTDEPQDERK